MEQLDVIFTPANGGSPQTITIRIGTPVRGERSWTARVEVLADEDSHAWTCHGEDWAQVLELSTYNIPVYLQGIVHRAGGGTLDPPFRVLLQVTGLEEPYSHHVHGADALHAFLECCWLVSEILPSLVPEGSRLTWQGKEDHWGAPIHPFQER